MEPSLPSGYHLERDPVLLLRRPGSSLTAAFSVTGATAEAVEHAAWEDRGGTGDQRDFCRGWKNQEEITVRGSHFVQEDSPQEIGETIRDLLSRVRS